MSKNSHKHKGYDMIKNQKLSFFNQMNKRLEEASQCLSFCDFRKLFESVFRQCLKKSEVDLIKSEISSQTLESLSNWLKQYGSTLQLQIRLLMLEAQVNFTQFPQQSLSKLNKVKHLLLDTQYQYLLPKVFILESKIYRQLNDSDLVYKSLKKSIDYGQNFVVEYLKQSNQIRLELADSMIISYFEMYKYTKVQSPQSYQSITHNLSKAYKAASKNYGPQHFSAVSLLEVLSQEKRIISSLNRFQAPKPVTDIRTDILKNNLMIHVCYNWEEESLVCVLKKIKKEAHQKAHNIKSMKNINSRDREQKILAQNFLMIRLDMNNIKLLKNIPSLQYIEIQQSANNSLHHNKLYGQHKITIIEEQLASILNKQNQQADRTNEKKTHVSLLNIKPINKAQVIKGVADQVSSSSQDNQAALGPQHQALLKCLYYGTNTNNNYTKNQGRHHQRSTSKDVKSSRN